MTRLGRRLVLSIAWAAAVSVLVLTPDLIGAESVAEPKAALPPLGEGWKPLDVGKNRGRVWIHPKEKQVAVDGEVSLTKGYLEMFACIANTKEHESVVAMNSKAFAIHAALLAVGAKSGAPAQWRPSYVAAHGTTIHVFVEYLKDGKPTRVKAQQWIRDLKTQKAMTHDWVFAGSSFWQDPETKKNYYRAESGDVICVSNFPTAMMDLPVESSQVNDELAFEAFTEHIPPRHTPVRVYLVPQLPHKAADGANKEAAQTKPKTTAKAAAESN